MIDLLKDRHKLGLMLASLFLIGILISAYHIYRLPHALMLSDIFHPALLNVYLILTVTFGLGALALWYALNHRTELIVYRDKQLTESAANKEAVDANKTTISLDLVKESIRQVDDEKNILESGLHAICKQLEAGQGAVYLLQESNGKRSLELKSGYALSIGENTVITYAVGEGLIGQAAASAKTLYIDDVPDGYIKIISGLGSASPHFLLITALKKEERVLGVIEIASFTPLTEDQRKFVEESAQLMADKMISK
jgi:putative methionine-R-sulfoxide reductase with GAF domain